MAELRHVSGARVAVDFAERKIYDPALVDHGRIAAPYDSIPKIAGVYWRHLRAGQMRSGGQRAALRGLARRFGFAVPRRRRETPVPTRRLVRRGSRSRGSASTRRPRRRGPPEMKLSPALGGGYLTIYANSWRGECDLISTSPPMSANRTACSGSSRRRHRRLCCTSRPTGSPSHRPLSCLAGR